jgi:hypothetical protein
MWIDHCSSVIKTARPDDARPVSVDAVSERPSVVRELAVGYLLSCQADCDGYPTFAYAASFLV